METFLHTSDRFDVPTRRWLVVEMTLDMTTLTLRATFDGKTVVGAG